LPRSRLTPGQRAGMFGFRVQRVPSADSTGVLVQEVIPGTAAEGGGLLAGDVITAVDGLDFSHGDEAYWPLVTAPVATTVTFTLARGASLTIVSRARP
ncbi:MAG: PDZ domain-containing protein, partial [Polyangiales bacterium]